MSNRFKVRFLRVENLETRDYLAEHDLEIVEILNREIESGVIKLEPGNVVVIKDLRCKDPLTARFNGGKLEVGRV